ncbi:MAG: 50S ribosomal protein L30 [Candidatus Riflebacteria bacterium]|nr:50S ribosomal protein L30 [Candidatus Riflebacteria bacterium]
MAKLEITLVRGLASKTPRQRDTAISLGLNKKHKTVVHDDTPAIRGKIETLLHMITVRETEEK